MMHLKKSGLGRFILYSGLFILILLAAIPFFITRAVNTPYVKNRIFDHLSSKTGIQLETESFEIVIFPQPGLRLKNFNFTLNPDTGIDIDTLELDIDFFRLFQGQVSISQIRVLQPRIRIAEPGSPGPSDKALNQILPELFSKVQTIFHYLPSYQNSVELVLKNMDAAFFKNLNGTVSLFRSQKKILVHLSAQKIAVVPTGFSTALARSPVDIGKVASANARLTINYDETGEIKGEINLKKPVIRSKQDVILLDADDVDLVFNISETGHLIDINPFKLNYPNAVVGVSYKNDLNKKKAEIEFSGSGIHLGQARKMALTAFKTMEVPETLFDILRTGLVPEVTVSFRSDRVETLFDAAHMEIDGFLRGGTVRIPETQLTARNVSGHAHVTKGVIDIQTDQASINHSNLKKGALKVDLIHYSDHPFTGEFLLDVDLSEIPETLRLLLPDTLLAQELSKVHKVTGRAETALSLLFEHDADDLSVRVNTNAFSAQGFYDRIPGELSIKQVQFTYQPDSVTLENLTGTVNGTRLDQVNLSIDTENDYYIRIGSGSARIDLNRVVPWLMSYEKTRKILSPVTKAGGTIRLSSVRLDGPLMKPETWQYNLSGSAIQVNIQTEGTTYDLQDINGNFTAMDDRFEFMGIKGVVSRLSWLSPLLETEDLNSVSVPLSIKDGFLGYSSEDFDFRGTFSFPNKTEVDLDFAADAALTPKKVIVKIKDPGISGAFFSYTIDQTGTRVLDFDGLLDSRTLEKVLTQNSHWDAKLAELTEGQTMVIHTDTSGHLNIIVKRLNLNAIDSQEKTYLINLRDTLDGFGLLKKSINFKADKISYKKLSFTDVNTLISLKKGLSYFKILSADLCGIEISGYINFKDDLVLVNIPFVSADATTTQALTACLLQKPGLMEGQCQLTGRIQARSPKENFTKAFTGSFDFNSPKGRIYKLTLLSRILTVLNVSQIFKGSIPDITQDGFAYDTFTIEAQIKESRINLTKAVIDGQDMTLIFTGWIDPINDKLNLTCLVAPFKTVDLIIKKLPIINTLLGGRLVSVPVRASGKLSDPDVIPLHPSAVGKGLVDMMTTILKTPVKLWDKVYGEQ